MDLLGVVVIFFLYALLSDVTESPRTSRRRRTVRRTWRAPVKLSKDVLMKPEWFEQKLDHFNASTTTTWKQKYHTNANYYTAGGPVFLYVGGEGAVHARTMVYGAWVEYAKEFHALCFQLEHRFYGESHPTKDLSVQSLAYLSSQQALADLASFIRSMNSKYNLTVETKWIAFGVSYAGSLAAWMRLKYPDLVHAAVSSSAPLKAEADFKDYYGTVVASLSTIGGESCVKAIHSATKQMDEMINNSDGRKTLQSKFSLCDSIDTANSNDVSTLYGTLAGYIAGEVQYNSHDWSSWNSSTTNIDKICNIMNNATQGSPLDRYAAVNNLLTSTYGDDNEVDDEVDVEVGDEVDDEDDCLDFSYKDSLEYLFNTSWGSDSDGDRQWLYQTCTEFGFFDTSSQTPHVFGDKFPVDYFVQQCTDVFGSRFNKTLLDAGIARTNEMYGGLSINASNILFVQNSIDPWHALGITKNESSSNPVICIQGTSHGADMFVPSPSDLPTLTAAHEEIHKVLKKWLSNYASM